MGFLIGLLIIVFIVGLIFREKGDSFLDTLSSGCLTIIFIVVAVVVIIILIEKGII